jgi:hypothetical protein
MCNARWIVTAIPLLISGCGFAQIEASSLDKPGFLMGLWHGILAPWSFLARAFGDFVMYAFPNSGWAYDLGFLIGVPFCFHLGIPAALLEALLGLLRGL